jgi:hypothetical protein
MKKLFLFISMLLGPLIAAQAQKLVSTFRQAEGTAYAMQKLDAQYKSAVHSDSSQAVFKGEEEKKLIAAYQKLLQEVGKHLTDNGFKWDKPTRCFNRFYFSKDGSIDYYLFNINPQEADSQKQAEFQQLMSQFIQGHTLQIQGPVKFSQCSPVVYKD